MTELISCLIKANGKHFKPDLMLCDNIQNKYEKEMFHLQKLLGDEAKTRSKDYCFSELRKYLDISNCDMYAFTTKVADCF